MKYKYTTPVVFDVNGTITLTTSQIGKLGVSDPETIYEFFKNMEDELKLFNLDPDEMLTNWDKYVTDPDDIEQWLNYIFSLGQE